MSHHVQVRLPDGRDAIADYRQPIAGVMKRIIACYREGQDGDPGDYAIVAGWLDEHPEQACTAGQVRLDTCTHPQAEAGSCRAGVGA